MATLTDPARLSYTNKDIEALDQDISQYILEYIPQIKGMTVSNEGRLYLRVLTAILDMLNYSVDMQFRESNIVDVYQLKNAISLCKLVGYYREGAAGSQCDVTFTMLVGVAGAGGQGIPMWTQVRKSTNPTEDFVTIEAATIPEGSASISGVPVIQGTAVSGEALGAAPGTPSHTATLANTKAVESQIRVYVGGTLWTKVEDQWDSDPGDNHYWVTFDESNICTIRFGDGVFGRIPPGAAAITADYVYTDGLGHDVGVGELDTVIGALSTTISVTNPAASTGGDDGDTTALMRTKAPQSYRTNWSAVSFEDIEEMAMEVEGVYSAKVYSEYGNDIGVYILPTGGGTASAALIAEVGEYCSLRSVAQGVVTGYAVESARVRIEMNVITFNNKVSKSVLRKMVRDTILAQFTYTNYPTGYGYTLSEVGSPVLTSQESSVFRAVDFDLLTRWPRVEQSNPAAPAMNGDVQTTSTAGYDTWVITAVTVTTYRVAKNGWLDTLYGTVGVSFTSTGSEVTFTLGTTTDTFTVGDTWTFKTMPTVGNILVEETEVMTLDESDLKVTIYYPGEYNAAS